jgi:uncharacterized membrane protein
MTMFDRVNKWVVSLRFSAVTAALCCLICAASRAEQPSKYRLVDLGLVGPAGQPFDITNNGIIAGAVENPKRTADHAVIYFDQSLINISKPGLGGTNSEAIGANGWGEVVGGANTPNVDHDAEDFCGFQTTLGIPSATESCKPFLWQNGDIIALPTLDDNHGNNGVAYSINDRGEVAGAAENTTLEPGCPAYEPANYQFQQYQFKPVVWRHHEAEELATVGGDPVGAAKAVNNSGQAVGATGTCSVFNLSFGFPVQPVHAVLWEKDGTPIDLKSLGGNEHSLMGNYAESINNSGHVVGASSLSDNVTLHGFFWARETGKMQDLAPISNTTNITNSLAIAINDSDEIVGSSLDFATQFVATIWKHGVATDLNTLIPANSSLHLMFGCSINSSGEIIGSAADAKGDLHGYELIPNDQSQW